MSGQPVNVNPRSLFYPLNIQDLPSHKLSIRNTCGNLGYCLKKTEINDENLWASTTFIWILNMYFYYIESKLYCIGSLSVSNMVDPFKSTIDCSGLR